MLLLHRLIWWKCAFYLALGVGLGLAVAMVLPSSGPGGARRIAVERFIAMFQNPVLAGGDHVTSITRYPVHDGVELLMLDVAGTHPGSAYAYGKTPFASLEVLDNYERAFAIARALKSGRYMGSIVAVAALRGEEIAAHAEPAKAWKTSSEFLNAMQARHPELVIRRAWWADETIRQWLCVAAGMLTVGVGGSLLLARRSADEQAAHELMSVAPVASSAPKAPSGPSDEDLRKLAELDEALERNLNSEPTTAPVADLASNSAQPMQPNIPMLNGKPLEVAAAAPKEDKDYAGDFYPTERRIKRSDAKGFSLVELLVVIGIIAIIMGLLLPTLIGARRSSDTITCAANLHNIAQGFTIYLQSNHNTFPASYTYIGQTTSGGKVNLTGPGSGYVHWSSFLYGDGSIPKSAFTCPAMERGGLPPTNTPPDNRNPGQQCPNDTIVDEQAPRMAYTANEALCPRNKFNTGFQSAVRTYRYVKVTEVANSSGTILATEMVDNGNMVSYGDSESGYIMSHRPIQGFANNSSPDIFLLPIGAGFRPCTPADLDPDPMSETTSNSRLDLVGRNHGAKKGYPDRRLSNFAYVDGHVETKSVYDTLQPFQWGAQFYSLVPNNDLQQ